MWASRMSAASGWLAAGAWCLAMAAAGPVAAQTMGHLKWGMLVSATGPGAFAGASSTAGVKMALAELNKADGILGRPIDLVSADDQSDPTAALNEAIRLTNVEKINFMYGPQLSALALAVAPRLNEAGIVWVTATTAADQLTTSYVPQHFSMLFTAQSQGVTLADAAARLGYKRIASLADDGISSKQIVAALKEAIAKSGVTLVATEEWKFGDTDMTPQLLTLRRANPEAVVVQGSAGEGNGYVLKGMSEVGWTPPILGGPAFAFLAGAAIKISGAEAFSKAMGVVYKGTSACPSDPLGQALYAQFLTKLQAFDPDSYAKASRLNVASGYDTVYMLKAAAEATKSVDGRKMAPWLEDNVGSLKLALAPLEASKTNHFLIGAASQTMGIDLANVRADGLQKRAGC